MRPEIGKLSAAAVENIPLVLYIPAPPMKDVPQATSGADVAIGKPELAHTHSYPPERECRSSTSLTSTGTRVQSRSMRWFTFRRIRPKKDRDGEKSENGQNKSKNEGKGDPYEEKWEKGEYPFVKLEENRAVCAICLCDFEEPKRVRYSIGSIPRDLDEAEAAVVTDVVEASSEDVLRLTDPGAGAQPLRLLDCAHVFHKTCIDPWLTDVSGRCPVCQRPVEVKEPPSKSKRR